MHARHRIQLVNAVKVIAVALLIGAALGAIMGAASASTPPTPTTNNSSNVSEIGSDPGEQIQPGLVLVGSSFDNESGQARLTLQADEYQTVTVTDAGAFQQGGEIPRRVVVLEPGETTIEMPATKVRGYVGVSIGTDQTLYAEVIESPNRTNNTSADSPFKNTSPQAGWIGGAAAMALGISAAAIHVRRRKPTEPEVLGDE